LRISEEIQNLLARLPSKALFADSNIEHIIPIRQGVKLDAVLGKGVSPFVKIQPL
jgi:hypothetical protein